jgi:Tfp pilus assembly protein PilV
MVNAKRMRGMSTLEIVIAFAILTVSLTALVSVVFGNQSVSVDTETNTEALGFARGLLEQERALASTTDGFLSASTTGACIAAAGQNCFYHASTTIADITECKKQATIDVNWATTTLRSQYVELTSFLSSTALAQDLGGDCPVDPPDGGWNPPHHLGGWNPNDILPNDIDVLKKIAYLALDNTKTNDLAIVDVSSPASPNPLFAGDVGSSPGFNAIDIAAGPNNKIYAYIANNQSGSGQLQVIDVTIPTAPVLVATASSTLTNAKPNTPTSIFYYDNKVYIGTAFVTPTGDNEFHIFNVTDPTHPSWITSIKVNRNVNAIFVQGGKAYLATGPGSSSPYNPFQIYDVDPSSLTYKKEIDNKSFTRTGTGTKDEQGRAVYVLGNTAYFGLDKSKTNDFYALNVATPSSIVVKSQVNLGLTKSTAYVSGIVSLSGYTFIGANDSNHGLFVQLPSGTVVSYNNSNSVTGIDMENNTIYLASYNGKYVLEILGP